MSLHSKRECRAYGLLSDSTCSEAAEPSAACGPEGAIGAPELPVIKTVLPARRLLLKTPDMIERVSACRKVDLNRERESIRRREEHVRRTQGREVFPRGEVSAPPRVNKLTSSLVPSRELQPSAATRC